MYISSKDKSLAACPSSGISDSKENENVYESNNVETSTIYEAALLKIKAVIINKKHNLNVVEPLEPTTRQRTEEHAELHHTDAEHPHEEQPPLSGN